MNCPQCQAANEPGAAFCGNCGGQLAPAQAAAPTAGYASPGASTPLGYNAPNPPGGYGAPGGYSAAQGGYAPQGGPADQQPAGYPPAQYQQQGPYQPQGQYQPQTQYPPPGAPQRQSSGLPPAKFDLNRLNIMEKVVFVATLITMISIWLPWFTATASEAGITDSASVSGTGQHGWFLWPEFLVALALLAYLAARAAWERLPWNLPIAHAPLLMVGTGLQLLLILISFVLKPSLPAGEDFGGVSVSIGWGVGAFIGLIGALVAAGVIFYPGIRSYMASRNPSATGGPRQY